MIGGSTTVGFIAGVLTTAANVPQVWTTYRNRSGKGYRFECWYFLRQG